MLARCPNCRNTFSTERAGRQDCPVCGKPVIVPEQPAVPLAQPAPEAGTPWERRGELGVLPAWTQTVSMALLEPGKLFASARIERTSDHLSFALLTISVFWAIEQIVDRALMAGQRDAMRRLISSLPGDPDLTSMAQKMIDTQTRSWPVVIGLTLFTPVIAFVFIYLNAGVTHGFALLLGQSKRGFPATFTACAYACAPLVLLAVPACGSPIAVIWLVVLTGIGLKITHRISTAGATAAVLTPYLLLCCLGVVTAAAVMMTFRNVMANQ